MRGPCAVAEQIRGTVAWRMLQRRGQRSSLILVVPQLLTKLSHPLEVWLWHLLLLLLPLLLVPLLLLKTRPLLPVLVLQPLLQHFALGA